MSRGLLSGLIVILRLASGACGYAETNEQDSRIMHAKETSISVGADLDEALKSLRSHGIKFDEVVTASVVKDGNEHEKEFVIHPLYESEDALILRAKHDPGTADFRVTSLDWHIKYAEDAKLPQLFRGNRILTLRSVDVGVLLPNKRAKQVRQRDSTNPFE